MNDFEKSEIVKIFDGFKIMIQSLNKKIYEGYFEKFNEKYLYIFEGLHKQVVESDDKNQKAKEIGKDFINIVEETFKDKKGRVKSAKLTDLNLFLIYYVFPSILGIDDSKELADGLLLEWNERFKTNLSYATYSELHSAFKNKILGIDI